MNLAKTVLCICLFLIGLAVALFFAGVFSEGLVDPYADPFRLLMVGLASACGLGMMLLSWIMSDMIDTIEDADNLDAPIGPHWWMTHPH